MERLDSASEQLLFRLLKDIESGALETHLRAVDTTSHGGRSMIVYSKGPQLSYEGSAPSDLIALEQYGFLTATPSGGGSDVIVLPRALAYRSETTRPAWKGTGLRTLRRARQFTWFVLAVLLGAILNELARAVIWPWLQGIVSLPR